MVGVGHVHAVEAPEQGGGRVAAHDKVVAGVVGATHAGKVLGHAGRVAEGAGVAVGIEGREGPGRNSGHFVVGHGAVFGAPVHYLHLTELGQPLGQAQVEHHFLAGGYGYFVDEQVFVTDAGYAQFHAAYRHVGQAETTFGIGAAAQGRLRADDDHGGPNDGGLGTGVEHRAAQNLSGRLGLGRQPHGEGYK